MVLFRGVVGEAAAAEFNSIWRQYCTKGARLVDSGELVLDLADVAGWESRSMFLLIH
jgi:hypothetical protein